jgi:hypothetical protein
MSDEPWPVDQLDGPKSTSEKIPVDESSNFGLPAQSLKVQTKHTSQLLMFPTAAGSDALTPKPKRGRPRKSNEAATTKPVDSVVGTRKGKVFH